MVVINKLQIGRHRLLLLLCAGRQQRIFHCLVLVQPVHWLVHCCCWCCCDIWQPDTEEYRRPTVTWYSILYHDDHCSTLSPTPKHRTLNFSWEQMSSHDHHHCRRHHEDHHQKKGGSQWSSILQKAAAVRLHSKDTPPPPPALFAHQLLVISYATNVCVCVFVWFAHLASVTAEDEHSTQCHSMATWRHWNSGSICQPCGSKKKETQWPASRSQLLLFLLVVMSTMMVLLPVNTRKLTTFFVNYKKNRVSETKQSTVSWRWLA